MRLTTNGNQEATLIPGRDYAIFVAGWFGGGTLALSVANADLSGVLPVPGYESTDREMTFILTAPSHRLLLSLTGATAPDVVVDCVLCPSGT